MITRGVSFNSNFSQMLSSCVGIYMSSCVGIYNKLPNPAQVSTVDCYDPEKNEWTFKVAPMSTRRSSLGVGVAPTFLF